LLRLREDQGRPGLSDAAFVAQHLERRPEWGERPGLADTAAIIELAKELGLARGVQLSRDYDHVVAEHRDDASVLICTERAPDQTALDAERRVFVTLLQCIDEKSFTVWCPFPSGLSDVLPAANRVWWDRWLCTALVFHS
jgi:hypothetical protein